MDHAVTCVLDLFNFFSHKALFSNIFPAHWQHKKSHSPLSTRTKLREKFMTLLCRVVRKEIENYETEEQKNLL